MAEAARVLPQLNHYQEQVMHTSKFKWMIDRVELKPPKPAKPMRLQLVRARNCHGFTIETRHYSSGEVALRHAECAAAGLELVKDDHSLHLHVA